LKLTKNEEAIWDTELHKLPVEEAKKMIEITTSWHEKGRQEGLKEGKIEGELEMARNFLLMVMDIENVTKAAGLPVEKIMALQKSPLN
jgi:predicted transposase/invertase (TIGR01784 family)